jgi:hypothetical protein
MSPFNPAWIFVLVTYLGLLDMTLAIDIGKHGTRIIMQEDSESILISKPLAPMVATIEKARYDIALLRKITMESLNNELSDMTHAKMRISALNTAELGLKTLHEQMSRNVQSGGEGTDRVEKRALEFLGDFLSTVTGVPSARDHRMLLEQVKAVRSENKGIETLMGQQNAENAKILRRLHFHESQFSHFDIMGHSLNASIFKNEKNIEKTEALLSIIAKVNLLTIQALNLIKDIESILQASDAERLSRSSVSPPEISKYLTKIYSDRESKEAPLFTSENLDFYYQEKLSHSWIERRTSTLYTLIQIPIAVIGKFHKVLILPPAEQIHGGFPLCAFAEDLSSYRFLSQSDYIACRDVGQTALCQKRKIELFDPDCYDLSVCKPWKHTLVHDLSNSKILFTLPNSTKAILDCTNKKAVTVDIPERVVATLNIHCSLKSDRFIVSKLTFRHMMEATQTNSFADFKISSEKDLLFSDPKYDFNQMVRRTNESLESMITENENFNITLNDFINKSDRQWETLNAGAYPLEQILLWSACTFNLILALFLAVYLIRLRFLVLEASKGGDGREGDQQRLLNLANRVMDLETTLHFGDGTLIASTPKIGEKPFTFNKE